jgi:hypothetical protein
VRVEARRLRSKLQEYDEAHGSGDAVVIELPKGSYAAVFKFRSPENAAHGCPLPWPSVSGSGVGVLPQRSFCASRRSCPPSRVRLVATDKGRQDRRPARRPPPKEERHTNAWIDYRAFGATLRPFFCA